VIIAGSRPGTMTIDERVMEYAIMFPITEKVADTKNTDRREKYRYLVDTLGSHQTQVTLNKAREHIKMVGL